MPDAPSPLQQAITALAGRHPLSEHAAAEVFGAVMRGEATEPQIAALLMGLRVKGETPEEVAGAARALREAMVRVESDAPHLVDTCGTGGGAVTTFNISTAAAFVTAGAGATVAKHGNRSFTSKCGSADVLEALGVGIGLDAAGAARVLREARIAFLFAPAFHPAMRHVGPVRRELGITSVMNLVGPLANPAGARRQVVGVADRERAPLLAQALARLGAEHALVVHARIGMDEIAPPPLGITDVWEIRSGRVTTWELDPTAYDLPGAGGEADGVRRLRGGDPAANASRLERILSSEGGEEDAVGRAAVLLNAGAAIYVAGLAADLTEGVRRAGEAVASGAARAALDRLRRASPSTSG
jgi:anthranilate phosphoribosyltransferase